MKRLLCCFLVVVSIVAFSFCETVAFAETNKKTTKITEITSTKTGMKVSWSEKDVNGYQIEYSKNKTFKNKNVIIVNRGKTKSKIITKIDNCTKYFLRVRTFVKSGNQKLFSKWSRIKTIELSHKYSLACCTNAATCFRGGKQQGEALGHNYSKATCYKPKICVTCRKKKGKALKHNLKVATCTTPAICVRCNAELRPALGHTYSWNQDKCNRCGNIDPSKKAYTVVVPQSLPLTFIKRYEYSRDIMEKMEISSCDYVFSRNYNGRTADLKITIKGKPTYDDFFDSANCLFYCNITGPNGYEEEKLVISDTVRIGRTFTEVIYFDNLSPGQYTIRFYQS